MYRNLGKKGSCCGTLGRRGGDRPDLEDCSEPMCQRWVPWPCTSGECKAWWACAPKSSLEPSKGCLLGRYWGLWHWVFGLHSRKFLKVGILRREWVPGPAATFTSRLGPFWVSVGSLGVWRDRTPTLAQCAKSDTLKWSENCAQR